MPTKTENNNAKTLSFEAFKQEVLNDYRIALISRECSLLGRREVLTGKAKFGIFGDGKELPQIAMAKAFQKGDWRSGYYRDQTFMMALDLLRPEHFFAGLYAHVDIEAEPMSAGRQMGGHFMTHSLDEHGNWVNLVEQYNSSSDISPTAGQMPRLLGLAQASKVFKSIDAFPGKEKLTNKGAEVAWGTIGNASTSEGHFFETINAAGVLQVPMVISVWDDAYGISVHAKHQTTKENISEILSGFQRDENHEGYEIIRVNGWDYPALVEAYERAGKIAREESVPVLVHVQELTQPQGHSTSGSHERYKSKERLSWELKHDCNSKMRDWILEFELESPEGDKLQFVESEDELIQMEKEAKKIVSAAKRKAWNEYLAPMQAEQAELSSLLGQVAQNSPNKAFIEIEKKNLEAMTDLSRGAIFDVARKVIHMTRGEKSHAKDKLKSWLKAKRAEIQEKYSSKLYSDLPNAATNIVEIPANIDESAGKVDGRVVMRDNFEALFNKYPEALIFGEDAGFIGDVNQGLEGLQEIFGATRVADTGIREATIIGQGIGMAMRGLRPIAEIQYLDYLLYGFQTLSDDLSTLRYRTYGKQKAPLIVRTRGHRLEGIWHSGSPLGVILNGLRGMYVLTPRNMVKAAGFYNTLMKSDEPALVIENLNGYRLKEQMPSNLAEFTTPIGIAERIREGQDITVVSYGSTLRLVEQAAGELAQIGISVEIIDAQSLLPFDMEQITLESVQKTNRLLIVDEDLPGGASAYLMQEITEKQGAYKYLDSAPQTLTAQAHRPAYGSDGDYFSKPSKNDIYEKIYGIIAEAKPSEFPEL